MSRAPHAFCCSPSHGGASCQLQQRLHLILSTHNRSAHRTHLLLCSLPEESRTGSDSRVQESVPLLKSSSYALQSTCQGKSTS